MEFDLNLEIEDAYTGGFIHLQTFNSLTFGVCAPHKYIMRQGSSKISARFHQGFRKIMTILLTFSGVGL
jgi:hypothetical protein